jgi:prepilin-type processing-associated H-X9-DG protein
VGSENIRDWNGRVRRLADSLPDSAETKFGFSCQCGCGKVVALTSGNFDANGAWADGHKPGTTSEPEVRRLTSEG